MAHELDRRSTNPVPTVKRRRDEVLCLAESLLGSVVDVVHQPFGHAGMTFEVKTATGEFILKTREGQGAFDHTEHHISVLRSLAVPTPMVVEKGRHQGFCYLLLRKIPGQDLGFVLGEMSRRQMTRMAGQIVQIERRVTSLPQGHGFGWTAMTVPGPFTSWAAVIERDSAEASAEVRTLVERWKPYFNSVLPTCFLDDLTVKNVIVQAGVLQGIVDLDEVCFGDPLYWLSLAEVTSILDVGDKAAFYGCELRRIWGMTASSSAVCDLYCLIHTDAFLNRGVAGQDLVKWAAEKFANAQAFSHSSDLIC